VWKSLFRKVFATIYATCARLGDADARGTAAGAKEPAEALTLPHSRNFGDAADGVAPPAAAAGAQSQPPVNQISDVPKVPNPANLRNGEPIAQSR